MLFSAVQQCESALSIHIYHLSLEKKISVWIKLKKFELIDLKINTKGITDLQVKHNTIQLLEDNIKGNVADLDYETFKVQFSSVAQSCPTLWPHESQDTRPPCPSPTPEFTQTHVHRWVGDAIQPSHPLLSPSPPAPNPSQHQGLFQWVTSLHEVAKVLEFQLQHQSFQWTPRTDLL